MATQTFPDIDPSRQSPSNRRVFAVDVVRFGDEYTQRVSKGINTLRETWQLVWSSELDTDVQTITDFLDAREGVESFFWTPPNGSQTLWLCTEGWNIIPENQPFAGDVSATFEEVHEATT